MNPSLTLTLSRIGRAAGLAPVAMLSLLAACDSAAVAVTEDGLSSQQGTEPEAAQPVVTDQVPENEAVILPAPELLPFDFDVAFTGGHVTHLTVTNVPEGSTVTLLAGYESGETTSFAGHDLEMTNGIVVFEGAAGADGTEHLRVLAPQDWEIDRPANKRVSFQAVVTTRDGDELISNRRSRSPELINPNNPGYGEFHPQIDDEVVAQGAQARVCVPLPESGFCDQIRDFEPWQTLETVSYALDRSLLPPLNAAACASENAFAGSCCYVIEVVQDGQTEPACAAFDDDTTDTTDYTYWDTDGRPFTTTSGKREATTQPNEAWSMAISFDNVPASLQAPLAEAWSATARAEHASVASFSRLVLELMSLGAPAELVAQATKAQLDEIHHAQIAYAVVSHLTGEPMGPGRFNIAGALDRSHDVEAILASAIVEGCIVETIASLQVREAASHTNDPALKAQLIRIADDELSHAELSWSLVRWLLATRPELHSVAQAAFAGFAMGPCPPGEPTDGALSAWGVRPASAGHALATEALEHVIRPAAQALLASVAQA